MWMYVFKRYLGHIIKMPVGGRTGTGKRWGADAGLLFVQQFYFPGHLKKKDYTHGLGVYSG